MARKNSRNRSVSQAPARQSNAAASPPGFTVAEIQASSFSGPLPHPEILRGYEDLVPGAAARIMAQAETQAAHRHSLERIALVGGARRANLGLWLGFIIVLVIVGLSALLIFNDHEWAGGVLGCSTLPSLAAVFVYGHRGQRQERLRKAPRLR